MKKLLVLLMCLLIVAASAQAEVFGYRFADADEGAKLLLSNRDYYENFNRNDLCFRLQKTDATLGEMETFAAAQVRDYTEAERAAVDGAMARIENLCAGRGYALPATDGVVFIKTTMAEENDAGGYTHGTQIYLGEILMEYALSDDPDEQAFFDEILAHELFHCLTRNHPDFRAKMYAILGFTVVGEDYDFPPEIRERIISNPDVEHYNSHAVFDIGGEKKDCVVIFTTGRPFEQPGDSFFELGVTGLVPVDDLGTMYTSDDAANFWDVFGKNTDYVIDPEETLADNFAFTILSGPEGREYQSPEIIAAIDALLKGDAK